MSKIKFLLLTLIVTVLISPIVINQAYAQDATCDEAGEVCCGNFGTLYCGGGLVCNKEDDSNGPVYICRDPNNIFDLTTCDDVDEPCCTTRYAGGGILSRFCDNNLVCPGLTCQDQTNNNIDYSECSISGNSCCPGSGLGGQPYCAPNLTKHETITSCICCEPGDDSCEPTSDVVATFDLCNSIPECLNGAECDCNTCVKNNGVWTALGCISFEPQKFIEDFLKIAIGIAGGIALLLMIYGSFLISSSVGDPKKAEEGKEIITGTIAGLLFIIFSVVLLRLIGVEILSIPGF